MKILMVNKFLYPNGGSETYIFKLGDYLSSLGHEVEYFGMEHERRTVGNTANCYTSNIEFHSKRLKKLLYPFKVIYSLETERKIRKVLDAFQPDIVHLNNFNFQLTPSVIYAVRRYMKQTKHKVRVIFTAHDYQLICPNHMMIHYKSKENCHRCQDGNLFQCFLGRCIHGSFLRSMLGTIEGCVYRFLKTYRYFDAIICPSKFMADKMNTNPLFRSKTVVLHNFIDNVEWKDIEKENYVLYFGRYSEEKGINTLIEVCKALPQIQFVFAGTGPMESKADGVTNIKNVGFQSGKNLELLIRKARLSIYPSEWYENCPFSVMESQMYGTPVLGADIGGIPELIEVAKTGELFQSGNSEDLMRMIELLWNNKRKLAEYSDNCRKIQFDQIGDYCTKLLKIYAG